MAQIVIDIPANITTRVMNALAVHYGYQANIRDANGNLITNPETKAAFVKRMVVTTLKNIVRDQEAQIAAKAAKDQAALAAESEIIIT